MKTPNQNQKVYINTKVIHGIEAVYKDGIFWGSIIGEPKPYKPADVLLWIDEAQYIKNWKKAFANHSAPQKIKFKTPSLTDENYHEKMEAAEAWRKQKTKNIGHGDDHSLDYWMNDMMTEAN